ncbi:MbtH family NRPS accessory protein [Candidatus Pantoea persica]
MGSSTASAQPAGWQRVLGPQPQAECLAWLNAN